MKISLIVVLFIFKASQAQTMMSLEDKTLPEFKIDSIVLRACINQPNYQKLNKAEREFYYWVNYSRSNPLEFYTDIVVPVVNLYPQLKGNYLESLKKDLLKTGSLSALNLNASLIKMAKSHAEDITIHNSAPSHNSTDGRSFSERFKKVITSKCGGENISYGGNNPIFLLILLYLDIDVPTLGHRMALLNPNFTETGVGSSLYSNGLLFLVEDFSCSE